MDALYIKLFMKGYEKKLPPYPLEFTNVYLIINRIFRIKNSKKPVLIDEMAFFPKICSH